MRQKEVLVSKGSSVKKSIANVYLLTWNVSDLHWLKYNAFK